MNTDVKLLNKEMEEDSEYEEEEYLVYVDIEPTSLSVNQIRNARLIKFYGIENNKPMLQINNQFFEGEYDFSMGTHVFFEKNEEIPVDPLFCKCDNYYQVTAKTNKVLKVSRVLVTENSSESIVIPETETDISDARVTRNYEEALNLFLPPGKAQPRPVPDEDKCSNLLTIEPKKPKSHPPTTSSAPHLTANEPMESSEDPQST